MINATRDFPNSVFDPINVTEKPEGSRFFLGQTVLHTGNNQFYTVCDLSGYEQDGYGLWPLGYYCAVPTHYSRGIYLSEINEEIALLPQPDSTQEGLD